MPYNIIPLSVKQINCNKISMPMTIAHLIEIIQLVVLATSRMHLWPVLMRVGWGETKIQSPKTKHWCVKVFSDVVFPPVHTLHYQIFPSHKIHTTVDPTWGDQICIEGKNKTCLFLVYFMTILVQIYFWRWDFWHGYPPSRSMYINAITLLLRNKRNCLIT